MGRPRKMTVPIKSAEFFKVFLPQLSNHRIENDTVQDRIGVNGYDLGSYTVFFRISPDFVKDFRRTIRERVVFKDVDGKGRHLSVKETADGVFLENEWESYVDYHSLKMGEFLVFRYDGAYSFVVKIFGTNGCKKKRKDLDYARVKIENKSGDEMDGEPPSHKRHREDQSLIANNAQYSQRSKKVKEMEQNVASKCPFFISDAAKSRTKQYKMKIPDEVIKELGHEFETDMILQNENGKEWPVKVYTNYSARMFGKGWYDFQIDNNVGLNDRCKFTFENKISACRTVKVQILRPGQDPLPEKPLKRGRGRPRKIANDNNFWVQVNPNFSGGKVDKVPYLDELPEFFKLYVADIYSETMRIPPDFIKEFGENIPTICTLKNPSGLSWKVDMKRVNDHWFFENGWPEFVDENSLQDYNFLTFAYARNSTFYVKIYSCNGCLKMDEKIDDETAENLLEDVASHQVHVESPKNRRNKRTTKSIEASQHETLKKRRLTTRSTITEIKCVGENPKFHLNLWKSYLANSYMPVPKPFWSLYVRKSSGMVTLWIKDNSWNMTLRDTGDRMVLVGDITNFARINSLKIGSVCTFELIDSNSNSNKWAFKVTFDK